MSSLTEKEQQVLSEFYLEYGKALSAWASLEQALSMWFQKMTEMPGPLSHAIFYSGRSFQTRRDLLSAALNYPRIDLKFRPFLRIALKVAFIYSADRNTIAHRTPILEYAHSYPDLEPKEITMSLQEGDAMFCPSGREDRRTVAHLQTVTANFSALQNILMRVFAGTLPPEEGLVRVHALPRPGHSSEPSQKPVKS